MGHELSEGRGSQVEEAWGRQHFRVGESGEEKDKKKLAKEKGPV